MNYLFGEYLLDTDKRELKRGAHPIALEPQVFDLLVYLIENRERVVSKDHLLESVWNGRIVSESTLDSRIHAARRAIGDTGASQTLIRTAYRKGVRFIGAVEEVDRPPASEDQPRAGPKAAASSRRQDIHFCTTSDGVRIAYAVAGQGPTLVRAAHWLNHLEYDWESPIMSPALREFAAGRRFVRYDGRGNGLSDWDVSDISFDGFVRDLEPVVEVGGLERFALLGMSQGGAIAIAYAARYPQRVTHLIIYGGYARGRRRRAAPEDLEHVDAMVTLMRQGWGQDNPAFRQLWTSLFMPGATPEQMQWFNNLQRITTSPENAIRMRRAMDDIDVTALLPQVTVPTLVLHHRGDAVAPFEEGRRLAAGIRGARFVALPDGHHVFRPDDPTWDRIFDEVNRFLRS
jgi:DNA-binding winged helix-turn-helix (wHTH) protein/pimeloyl-ACP methyl ester carboxylesterase